MTVDRKQMRYAHSDGHTDVCYSEDGQKLITCGTDGDIRIWSGFDDDDPTQTCVGEWSLCVRQKDNYLHVATNNNNIQLMTYPEAERSGILIRFPTPANHMAVGKKHKLIAIATENTEVHVMDISDPELPKNVTVFTEFSGTILSVALCPEAKLLATSCGDRYLRIWNIESSSLLKEFDCVPKVNTFTNAKLLCRTDFEPISGETFAYPNKNTVIIVNTSDWTDKTVLMCPEIESPYSIVQFSPCGKIIAATSQAGDLVLWNLYTKQVIGVTKHPRSLPICAMVWNPAGNGEIAFCDTHGQLGIATDCKIETPVVREPEPVTAEEENPVDFDGFQFEGDDDDDDENVVSLEKLKSDVMGTDDPELNFDKASSRSVTPRPRTPEIPMQAAFVPSSTPEHLNPRYLCWNDVGIVRSYREDLDPEDDANRSIEVEFHDTVFHNSMMIKNFQGYTMGSLSKSALMVASGSLITTIPLDSGAKEWSVSVTDEEEIICVACSNHLVCYATADYLVRVCSAYGTQKAVFSIPGPVVSLSAHDYFLLVAYHSGAPRKGDQCINIMLVKLEGMSIENRDLKSALKPEATVLWIGFTDTGTPAMQDSHGILYLYPHSANVWLPFCDTTKHCANPSDGFFVTTILESSQVVQGIRCRGSVYPGFTPRPTLGEIPLEPPFAELTTEKSQLEASLFTWSTLRVENVEKKLKETALKTFALACKNNLDQRALELIEMMANPQLVTLATKYATKLNKRRLAEKLVQIATVCDEDFDESNLSCSIISTPPPNILRPINRKFVLNSGSKRTPKNKIEIDEKSTLEVASNGDVTQSELEEPASVTKVNNTSLVNDSSLADITINTQESVVLNREPKNPFLKSLKKPNAPDYNPLSLTDKYAGFKVDEELLKQKESNGQNNEKALEKRKRPNSDTDKPKDKQRRLDNFMFSKRS